MYQQHNDIIVQSGEHTLQKHTKPQVKKIIETEGQFKGYLCGNRVNPHHISDGWGLGYYIELDSVEKLESARESFETGLQVYTPDLGSYAHYYRIIN